jgi:hypothetical protein
VLLPGLQREPVGRFPGGVDGDTDQPAGQHPLQSPADGEVPGVRAAERQRQAEPLGGADRDVGAQFAGGTQQRERQRVGGNGDDDLPLPRLGDGAAQVADGPAGCGVGEQNAEGVVEGLHRL